MPDAVLAAVMMAVIGFGGGFLEWGPYSGFVVRASPAMSAIGLASMCWVLAHAARWAFVSGRRGEKNGS
jgi:hypothetical protein